MTEENPKQRLWVKHPFFLNFSICFLGALIIKLLILDFYYVPTPSMEPTVIGASSGGERAVVNKLAYVQGEPVQGDIIVFSGPASWKEEAGEDMLKRVIATEGQTVECCTSDGKLLVDGKPLEEPYVQLNHRFKQGTLDCTTETLSRRCFPRQTVPEGHLWVMGDNRSASKDSSYQCQKGVCRGPIPVSSVIGQMKWSVSIFGL